MIPNLLTPFEDELLYSYFLRLSRTNGFEDIRVFMFHYVFSEENKKYYETEYDIRDDLYRFVKAANTSPNDTALPIFLKHTLFHGFAPLGSRAYASRYVGLLSRYRNPTKIITSGEFMVQKLKFCPKCRQEESDLYGCFYYHRAHQMPNVTVCHEHGCALRLYTGKHGQEMNPNLISNSLEVHEKSLEYAIFCKAFLDAKLECDVSVLLNAVLTRLRETGYDTPQKQILLSNKMKQYLPIMAHPPEYILKHLRQKNQINRGSLLTLLLFLFKNVENLKTYLKSNEDLKDFFVESIANKYTLQSKFREDIVELKCRDCGQPFITTPTRILSAWGCPSCDGRLDDTTLFRQLFNVAAKGEYTLLSDFSGTCEKVSVLHHKCERTYLISARDFLESNVKCACTKRSDEDDIRREVEASGMFELLEYHQKAKFPVMIRHKDCGRTFSANITKWKRNPHCYLCRRKELNQARFKPHSEFVKAVADLVKDEYTVVAPYVSGVTPISIRHNRCGNLHEYKPHAFLEGRRCPVCRQTISRKNFDKIVSEISLGRYTCVDHIPNKVIIQDMVTGEKKIMTTNRTLQELLRPTDSPLLPCKSRNFSVELPKSSKERLLEYLFAHYKPGDRIVLRSLKKIEILQGFSVNSHMEQLAKQGIIIRIERGIYQLP